MSIPKHIAQATALITAEGGQNVVAEVTRGNHVRYTFTDPRGRKHIVYGALTPSDWRGTRNFKALVRRMINSPEGE